ncbi:MAG TPA: OB-fold nucleic acid binding domain-containing protein, partial [Acidimicrobiales bacterium]
VTFVPYHLGRRRAVSAHKPSARRAPAPASDVMPAGTVLPDGVVPIASAGYRQRVTVAGRVHAIRVQPRAGVATLQSTITDGTGELQIVFLGRRHVAGVEQGALLCATGIVSERGGHREMLNPEYRLLSPLPGPHG